MEQGRIVLLTGAPGTGKTTTAAITAQASPLPRSVHMHTDDFFHYLSKGALPPHLPGSEAQNQVVIEAFLAAARRYVLGGYDVIVDGIVGPWFLDPWLRAAREGIQIHYIILRADRDETLRRAVSRDKLDRETNRALVDAMWAQFQDLGPWEAHVLDTTDLTPQETVSAIRQRLETGCCRLS